MPRPVRKTAGAQTGCWFGDLTRLDEKRFIAQCANCPDFSIAGSHEGSRTAIVAGSIRWAVWTLAAADTGDRD